jgi:hypothetical protein
MGDPLRGGEIAREYQEFRQQAHRRSLADAFGGNQMGKLAGQCGHATNQLQAAVVRALDAPFQVPDIDFDIVGNRVTTRSGKLRSDLS